MNKIMRIFAIGTLFVSSLTFAEDTNYLFSLIGADGKIYTEKSFPNQYTLIDFGYTHCPDICPTTLYDFKLLLTKSPYADKIQPIFISIDPKRDEPQVLQDYINHFDTKILGLTGSLNDVQTTVNRFHANFGYKINGKKVDVNTLNNDTYYDVYHSTLIYLLDDSGQLIDVFDYQSGVEHLTEGVNEAIKKDLETK